MYRIVDPEYEILAKYAVVGSNGKLYVIQFSQHYAFQCDPSPFPQEAVYEHMLSTWKFLRSSKSTLVQSGKFTDGGRTNKANR